MGLLPRARAPVTGHPEDVARRVREANRRLYDAVASRYEDVDGRRSPAVEAWLRGVLAGLRRRTAGGRLLDVGTGAGLVPRCARGVFEFRVGLDISPAILAHHRAAFDAGVSAEVAEIPFTRGSFDAITCFATLHHLPAFEGLAAEVARLLAPGGIFYSDHDMDGIFYRRFAPLLALYRRLHDARARYVRESPQITAALYDDAEWHQRGIPAEHVVTLLARAGLEVEVYRHWYGLNPIADRIFGTRVYPRGWAPLVAIVARRPGA
jgi:SAM-dependent methyltransferase